MHPTPDRSRISRKLDYGSSFVETPRFSTVVIALVATGALALLVILGLNALSA